MNLYIKVQNGVAVSHPALEQNLLDAFGGNIPSEWEPFTSTPTDKGVYQIIDELGDNHSEVYYKHDNGTWYMYHPVRDMTPEEKQHKIDMTKLNWEGRANPDQYTKWVFDEAICDFVAPLPMPTDVLPEGSIYNWDDATDSWRVMPASPTGGEFRFNYTIWAWEPVVI